MTIVIILNESLSLRSHYLARTLKCYKKDRQISWNFYLHLSVFFVDRFIDLPVVDVSTHSSKFFSFLFITLLKVDIERENRQNMKSKAACNFLHLRFLQGTRYKVQDTYQSKPALQAETPVTCDTRIWPSLQYHTNTPAKAAAHLKHQTKLISDGWISRLQTTWLRTVLARNSCGIYSSAHTVSMSTLIVR